MKPTFSYVCTAEVTESPLFKWNARFLHSTIEFRRRRQRAIQEAKAASAAAANRGKKGASYQRIEFNFPDPEFGGFRPVSQSHQYPSARSVQTQFTLRFMTSVNIYRVFHLVR